MKKKYMALATFALVGALTVGVTVKANNKPQVPLPETGNVITLAKNADKKLKSVDEFLSEVKTRHKDKDAVVEVKEKIAYKDIEKKLPDVKDKMHWVDGDRQIYVVSSKFSEYTTKHGIFKNAKVTDMWDAETGEHLGTEVTGTPDANFKTPIERHKEGKTVDIDK
ncbi:hypothetical protein J2T17_006828 [Paenibacillus mucilaginosus]|uniref:hypothetical protein n=1 Tax=Paenibacillus mucilaginosus TaxID=61624 RepID=UPI003D1EACF5